MGSAWRSSIHVYSLSSDCLVSLVSSRIMSFWGIENFLLVEAASSNDLYRLGSKLEEVKMSETPE
jgi:hypothetical protein